MKLFGTDGIRGIPNTYPLLASNISKIGENIAVYLKGSIAIGKDTRETSDWMELLLIEGIRNVGGTPISLGICPTASVSYYCKKHNCAGIMITASHNLSEYNGIKVFNSDGCKLTKEKEERLEYGIADTTKEYIDYVVDKFKDIDFSSIIISRKNTYSAPNLVFEEIIKKLKINNIVDDTLHIADIYIEFDSDGDRCILQDGISIIFDGDDILALLALGGEKVVGTPYTNTGLKEYLLSINSELVIADVGDRNVAEKMSEVDARIGGEQSGHIINKDYSETSDGIITALLVLKKMVEYNKPLSELRYIKKYPQRYESIPKLPYTIDNKPYYNFPIFNYDDARVVIRRSGTEPILKVMVEAKENVDKYMKEVLEKLDV